MKRSFLICVLRVTLIHSTGDGMDHAFFMAGLAVMLASVPEFDRRSLLDLAEALQAGSSQVEVFALWLERSPLRPSRFLPMLLAESRHAT